MLSLSLAKENVDCESEVVDADMTMGAMVDNGGASESAKLGINRTSGWGVMAENVYKPNYAICRYQVNTSQTDSKHPK